MTGPGPSLRHMGHLLAARTDGGRLVRGHEIFDDGLVRDVDVVALGEKGSPDLRVAATVYGSRHEPYRVDMRVSAVLPESARSLRFACTCPDWGDPCKHGVALALAYADHLDKEGPTVAGAEARSPSASERVAVTLSSPKDRPGWADDLPAAPEPVGLADWLGAVEASDRVGPPAVSHHDATAMVLDLGPLLLGSTDLAPAISLLLLALIDPD